MSKSSVNFKLFLVMCFWGSAFVSGRMLAQNYPPIVIAFLRFFMATVILFPMLYLKTNKIFSEQKINYLKFALLGLFGVCLYNVNFLTGLKTVEAGRSAMIIALNPVLGALFSFLFFKEKLRLTQVLGVIIGLTGTLIVLTRGDLLKIVSFNIGAGEIYLVFAVLSWITYTMLGKIYLRTISTFESITWACFFGLILLTPMAIKNGLIESLTRFQFVDLINLTNLGFFSTVLGFSWYYEGVKELGVAKTTSYINLLPLIGLMSGVLILNEKVTPPLLVGGVFILSGIFLVNKAFPEKK